MGWILNAVCLSLLALGMALVSAMALSAGDRAAGLLFGGGALLFVVLVSGMAPLLRVRRGWRSRKLTAYTTSTGERGVRIPYSGWWYGWMVVLLVVTVALFALLVPWVVFVDGFGSGLMNVAVTAIGIVGVPYLAWVLFDVARGRIVRGQVVLTASGVYHRSPVHDEFAPWDSIMSVSAGLDRGPIIAMVAEPGRLQRRLTSRVEFGLSRGAGTCHGAGEGTCGKSSDGLSRGALLLKQS